MSAASPLAVVSEILGWRGSFTVIGGVTLGLAVLIWFVVRNTPKEAGFRSHRPGKRIPRRSAKMRLGEENEDGAHLPPLLAAGPLVLFRHRRFFQLWRACGAARS